MRKGYNKSNNEFFIILMDQDITFERHCTASATYGTFPIYRHCLYAYYITL